MSTYPFREKLHVSTLMMIVAICLLAITILGQVRHSLAHQGEEIPQTAGRALSTLTTPGKADGDVVRTPSRLWMV